MFRAAHKTLSGFEEQVRDLRKAAVEGLPLGRRHSVTPEGWDSPAFCENLLGAYNAEAFGLDPEQARDLLSCVQPEAGGRGRGKLACRRGPIRCSIA